MAFNFGTTQPAQATAFGTTPFANPPASTGFAFGTPSAATSSAPFTFGTATQPQTVGFKIGTSAAAPTTTLGFGTSTAAPFSFGTSAAPTSTFGGFGTSTQAPAFGFGTSSAAPTSTFGGLGTTSTAPSFGFGTSSAAPTSTLSFGTAAPTLGSFGTTATPFSFGATTSAAPTLSFGAVSTQAPSFGGFGLQTSAPSGLATTNVITTTSTTPSLGLGGISSTPFGASTFRGQTDSKAFNEMPVPQEIAQTVEDFKKYVKEQKAKKDEVSRGSSKAPEKVGEEIEGLKSILLSLTNTIQQQTAVVQKLKHDAAQEIKNAEIAQRTKETAPSMQLDNTAPLEYFSRLIADFEQRMQIYKQQIEDTERNLIAINRQQSLTPQELMNTMKKLHEAFVLLAGRVHSIHTTLQNYKDDYLAYRRRVLADPTDIFARKGQSQAASKLPGQQMSIGVGPSPFGGNPDPLARRLTHLTNGTQLNGSNPAGVGASFGSSLANDSVLSSGTSGGLSFGTPGRPSGLFGSSGQIQPTAGSSFQLQSPPPGNKRNKR